MDEDTTYWEHQYEWEHDARLEVQRELDDLRAAARELLVDYSFFYPYAISHLLREAARKLLVFPLSPPFEEREAVKQLRKAMKEE